MPEETYILVVDDDPDIRDMVQQVLELEGYRVSTAADGHEAIHCLHRQSRTPSLILLDLMMPGMSGWELRDELRRDTRFHDVPVIVLSGGARADREAGTPGTAEVLRKPIDLDRLLEVVGQYC